MPKDRRRRRFMAPDAQIVIERSSAHPVQYAIVLLVERNGLWHAVHTFDNAHHPEEHHEHRYINAEKQSPIITRGRPNDAMHAAETRLREHWPDIVKDWESTR